MILEWEVDGRAQRYSLRLDARTTLGRSTDCDVVLTEATVSRRHAEIYGQGGTFYVRNLSRTNGVAVEYQYRITGIGYGEPALVTLRLRCPGPCGKVVEVPPSGFCPHCGTALATADTFVG